ncbi:glycosyl transferase [Pseudomonas taiwanensis]|uniref:glycosyltransferase family 2 protein n=1 Tax=Pseudomonas taiwanensis TaxID=470150 RepID=UPI0015BF6D11|nr:glycosyltransferase family 2 protein [Pseudomonas taiwanensis]NWL76371.1 glycosyl transferase [Pseudomonas taiwanensis]
MSSPSLNKVSIVSTLYQSSAYINEFVERASLAATQLALDYEIILVNDGSPDNSLEKAIIHAENNPHVKVIDLSRNFGHHKAMMTGLAHASGDLIFLIDSDLEEEPEWLNRFYGRLTSEHCDVVYGVQEARKGGLVERITGQWFYPLFRTLTGLSLPENIVTARLMTRRYVDSLLAHEEREVFMAGLWYITGYRQVAEVIKKHSTSESTYTFRRKMSLLVNSVTSFSNTPLIGIFYVGISISALASLYIAYLAVQWLFLTRPLSGWTSVMASIWLIGGLIISFIGVVGIYLSKIFSEVKRRPYTIVRRVYESKK